MRTTASSWRRRPFELGIDVGNLDYVIQIDAPPSVASMLQRLGRAGRREGSSRNLMLLATEDRGLLFGAAVLLKWSEGFIEPIVPPPMPLHLVGQQVLALALQEGQIGRATWKEWLGRGSPSARMQRHTPMRS